MSSSCCQSTARVVENIPILGHLMAACYACSGNRAKAERAAIKSTVGILLAPFNMAAEAYDEATRQRTDRLRSRPLIPRVDWMKRHRTRILRNICLPGTHSSGMYKITRRFSRWPFVDGWAVCQATNVYHQLIGGVRFLDARLIMSEKMIYVTDDAELARGTTLRDVVNAIRKFVEENPSEIVGLHLTEGGALPAVKMEDGERSPSRPMSPTQGGGGAEVVDWEKVHLLLQELLKDRIIPEIMKDLTINDIVDHGKNVFICGLPRVAAFSSYSWPAIDYRLPSKSSPAELRGHMESTLGEMSMEKPTELFWYRAECTPDGSLYAHNAGGVAGLVARHYDDQPADTYEFLADLASAANSVVLHVLENVTRLPFNVITTDHIHDEVIDRIIKLNDAADTGRYHTCLSVSATPIAMLDDQSIDELNDSVFVGGSGIGGVGFGGAGLGGTGLGALSVGGVEVGLKGGPTPPKVQYQMSRAMMTASPANNSNTTMTTMNTSFDIRHQQAAPLLHVRDTVV